MRKPIPSCPGYEADDQGNIWSHVRGRWGAKPEQKMSLIPQPSGYFKVNLRVDGKHKSLWVHRLVCEAFNGPAPSPELKARHLDDNHFRNVPSNLAWGTSLENADDARRNGTQVRGERVGGAKLTADDVREIINLHNRGFTYYQIADRYNVCFTCIEGIMCGKNWTHITGGRISIRFHGGRK
jgi:hypothetical protein